MTAPDRIWPVGGYAPGGYHCKCSTCGKTHMADKRAWQCADCVIRRIRDPAVLARDETVLAMVGAVIEEAAKQGDPWDGPVTKNKIVDAQAIAAQQIKARIRALAPADAAAALAAHDKRIRDEALADAAKFCRLRIMQNSPATDQDQAVAIDEAEVIEAAILRMKGAKP